MKRIYCFLLTVLSLSFLSAQSTYLAYEPFNGTTGAALYGSSGGTGWNTAWDVQSGATTGFEFGANSLTFNNLQNLGGSANGGNTYLTAGRPLDYDDGGAFDAYIASGSNSIGTTTGTTLFVSALLQKNNNNGQPVYADLHGSNISWCNSCSASNRVGFGYFGAASDVSGQRRWSLRIGETVYPTSIPVTVAQAAFFVLRINFNSGNTAFDLYVNPTSLGTAGAPASPTLSQTSSTAITLRSFSLYLGDNAGQGAADELRLATNYATAAPDNTVTINLPPTANFTVSPNSGIAPLTVSVNGTASSDPEGQALSYSWNFGDGTPSVSGVATTTHNFAAGLVGLITISLTVTDNLGLSHTAQQTVTLFNSSGTTFPCQTSITSIREAGCNESNGQVRINSGLSTTYTYNFRNSSNTAILPTNNNEFHNLAAGTYNVTVSGSNGCTDTYTLTMTTDQTTCAGFSVPNCDMPIGVNVNGIADWSREHAFLNRYKHVRSDLITFHDGCSCWESNVGNQLAVDADGYPTSIPQATTASSATKIRYVISSDNGNLRANEQYVFLYDGVGTFTFNGVTINSNTAGRVLFTVPSVSGNIWIDVNSSQAGNYMRNFRLYKASEENVNFAIHTFNPTFISRLSPFKAIRFMDWGHTNGSPLVNWADRALPSFRTYGTNKGVPYEEMIRLANETQKDIWVCVPHAASNDYITQMATLFKNTLNSNLTIYLEYSNEVWNWLFEQAHYNNNNRPANLSYGRAYAEKAKNTFQIWTSVFAGQTHRMKRVLGLQGGFNSLNEQIMAQIPQSEWDIASPSYYFGLQHDGAGTPALNGSSTAEDVNANARNAYFGTNGWLQTLKQDYRNIKILGKEINSYEGGQHYADFQNHSYQTAMYAAQYLPSMYQLYNDVLDTIRNMGNKLPFAFTLSGLQESVYGSWGHLSDMYLNPPFTSSAPKYQAILDNSCLPFVEPQTLTILPLELLNFWGEFIPPLGGTREATEGGKNVLKWRTENEIGVSHFDIERSLDGRFFEKIGQVKALNKNSFYQFIDENIFSKIYYYRLKINDLDGKSSLSKIISIERKAPFGGLGAIKIYPSVTSGILTIENAKSFEIINSVGQVVLRETRSSGNFQSFPNLSQLPNGIYFVKGVDTEGGVFSEKIVKQ